MKIFEINFPFLFVWPSILGVIAIGGAHVKPPKPLPTDVKQFLDEAEHGVIYFSLGSILHSSKLSTELIQTFLGVKFDVFFFTFSHQFRMIFANFIVSDTFQRLKQRVLWKYEDDLLVNCPSNVLIRKWMPQNDILAHPNIVLFISHGGLLGTIESLHHGVPILAIPFFGDQFRNAYRIMVAGNGQFMHFNKITIESFTTAIIEITTNETYRQRAKYISNIFTDNAVHPMDEAMFWIEHVAKFKGAMHLKSHARRMSWFTYLMLDIIVVDVLTVLIVSIVLFYAIKCILFRKQHVNAKR